MTPMPPGPGPQPNQQPGQQSAGTSTWQYGQPGSEQPAPTGPYPQGRGGGGRSSTPLVVALVLGILAVVVVIGIVVLGDDDDSPSEQSTQPGGDGEATTPSDGHADEAEAAVRAWIAAGTAGSCEDLAAVSTPAALGAETPEETLARCEEVISGIVWNVGMMGAVGPISSGETTAEVEVANEADGTWTFTVINDGGTWLVDHVELPA